MTPSQRAALAAWDRAVKSWRRLAALAGEEFVPFSEINNAHADDWNDYNALCQAWSNAEIVPQDSAAPIHPVDVAHGCLDLNALYSNDFCSAPRLR